MIRPFALATPPSRISKKPLKRIRSPPAKGFPSENAAPAATLTTKPSNVRVFGDKGIRRAIGIISFLALFLSSLKIFNPFLLLASCIATYIYDSIIEY